MTLDCRAPRYSPVMERARIGNLVKERRELLKKTQPQCAALSDMTKGNWWHIEHGTISAPVDTLSLVAKALEAHWEVRLIGGPTEARDPERQELIDLTDRLADKLSQREVQLLLGQLRIYEAEQKSKAT